MLITSEFDLYALKRYGCDFRNELIIFQSYYKIIVGRKLSENEVSFNSSILERDTRRNRVFYIAYA